MIWVFDTEEVGQLPCPWYCLAFLPCSCETLLLLWRIEMILIWDLKFQLGIIASLYIISSPCGCWLVQSLRFCGCEIWSILLSSDLWKDEDEDDLRQEQSVNINTTPIGVTSTACSVESQAALDEVLDTWPDQEQERKEGFKYKLARLFYNAFWGSRIFNDFSGFFFYCWVIPCHCPLSCFL